MKPEERIPPQLLDTAATGPSESRQLYPNAESPPPTNSQRLEFSDGSAVTMDTWQLNNRDIIRVTPDTVRTDTETGLPVIPLYVGLGIHGDRRLHWALTAFAQEYGGPTVGVVYRKPVGSARLVKTNGFDHLVPELEAKQADDLIEAIDFLGIKKANAVTESRGNTRVEIAAEKRPDLFEGRYHQDPVGHDGEGYRGTHMSALRIAFQGMRRKIRSEEADPLVAELRSLGVGTDIPRHSLRARRVEQKAVARTHHARLNEIATRNQYAPRRSVTYAGDFGDPGVLASKLRQRIEPIQATGNGVQYTETNKGRHGIGRSRRHVHTVSRHFTRG